MGGGLSHFVFNSERERSVPIYCGWLEYVSLFSVYSEINERQIVSRLFTRLAYRWTMLFLLWYPTKLDGLILWDLGHSAIVDKSNLFGIRLDFFPWIPFKEDKCGGQYGEKWNGACSHGYNEIQVKKVVGHKDMCVLDGIHWTPCRCHVGVQCRKMDHVRITDLIDFDISLSWRVPVECVKKRIWFKSSIQI